MKLNNTILFLILLICFSCKNEEGAVTSQLDGDNGLDYLALGNSYTIGASVLPTERWPVQLAQEFKKAGLKVNEPTIIAKTGWRTDNLLQAIENANPPNNYDLVSLLIGVNNQYQQRSITVYKTEFETLLKKSISLTQKNDPKRVLVLSIPDYGYTPFGESNQEHISEELNNYNAINKQISEKYGVWYVDIIDISRQGLDNPDLVANDGLHPSGVQYSLWVERILENSNIIAYLRQKQD